MSAWSDTDPELASLADQWAAEVQEGDVVKTKSGDLRIVRAVHRHPKATGKGSGKATKARRVWCFFAIKHCSWTGAGYTLYTIAEMVGMGWLPTSAKPRRMSAEIDVRLKSDFARPGKDRCVRCCEAVGLP